MQQAKWQNSLHSAPKYNHEHETPIKDKFPKIDITKIIIKNLKKKGGP